MGLGMGMGSNTQVLLTVTVPVWASQFEKGSIVKSHVCIFPPSHVHIFHMRHPSFVHAHFSRLQSPLHSKAVSLACCTHMPRSMRAQTIAHNQRIAKRKIERAMGTKAFELLRLDKSAKAVSTETNVTLATMYKIKRAMKTVMRSDSINCFTRKRTFPAAIHFSQQLKKVWS